MPLTVRDDARERILAGAYACVARYGLAKTTVDDVARLSGLSRATFYRYFPGGKDQLQREVVAWEVRRFFARLAEAVGPAPDLATMLVEGLLYAHRALIDHEVLQKVLQTEPELLLPLLSVEANRLLPLVAGFVEPYVARAPLLPGLEPDQAAGYLARMILSYIEAQGRWDLTDRSEVERLVRVELLGGIVTG
ncbi:MAG TPA: TetR/AcrR family transcriptional regulator [Acidimicrobiales bacterium]